jgi:hypothetical protein
MHMYALVNSNNHLHCVVFAAAQPRVASTEAIATWNELSRCPYIKEAKTIVHPGEVRCF